MRADYAGMQEANDRLVSRVKELEAEVASLFYIIEVLSGNVEIVCDCGLSLVVKKLEKKG